MKDMGRCHSCGGTHFEEKSVLRFLQYEGRHYLFRNVPATVCTQCGQEYFEATTHNNIMMLLRDHAPTHVESIDVYDLTGLQEKSA